jgi:hypothetical protein
MNKHTDMPVLGRTDTVHNYTNINRVLHEGEIVYVKSKEWFYSLKELQKSYLGYSERLVSDKHGIVFSERMTPFCGKLVRVKGLGRFEDTPLYYVEMVEKEDMEIKDLEGLKNIEEWSFTNEMLED